MTERDAPAPYPAPRAPAGSRESSARAWGTMALLGLGYIAIYLCRKNLSVAIPLIQEDPSINNETAGWISTVGTLAYAIGKVTSGPLVDRIGGRRGFLAAMFGVALFGGLSAFSPDLVFLGACYGASRFAGAGGWGAMMKLVPSWFPAQRTASVIAILSVSYVAGGAAATLLARAIHDQGGGWRIVMGGPAIVVVVVGLVAMVLLRAGPLHDGDKAKREGHGFSRTALLELLRRRQFIVACGLSFTVTLLREAFNTWSVHFFTSIQGTTKSVGDAAARSIGFDVAGVLGILIMGVAFDRLAPQNRRWLIAASLLALAATLAVLPHMDNSQPLYATALVALIGFLVYGPFSLLSGVMALDSGGARLVATAAGAIDGVGYAAGALSGVVFGGILDFGGYMLGFNILAALSLGSAALALLYRPIAIVAKPA